MKHLLTLTAGLLFVTLAPVLAASSDYTFVSRSWQHQEKVMTASLTVQVPVVTYDAQGHPVTTYQTQWVHVDVRIGQDAPLRKGEVEWFRVSAYASGAGTSTNINVHVDPDLVYHSYRGAYGSAFGHGHVYLTVFHGGRITNQPPATFENLTVDFSVPTAPFVLTFDDFAFDDNAEAVATYGFEIKREVFLFPDKLVARGEILRPASGRPTILITEGCPFTTGADEYFKQGKSYKLTLKVKRTGSSYYSEKFSNEAKFGFTWKKSGTVTLDREAPETPRSKVRTEKFRDVHHH